MPIMPKLLLNLCKDQAQLRMCMFARTFAERDSSQVAKSKGVGSSYAADFVYTSIDMVGVISSPRLLPLPSYPAPCLVVCSVMRISLTTSCRAYRSLSSHAEFRLVHTIRRSRRCETDLAFAAASVEYILCRLPGSFQVPYRVISRVGTLLLWS